MRTFIIILYIPCLFTIKTDACCDKQTIKHCETKWNRRWNREKKKWKQTSRSSSINAKRIEKNGCSNKKSHADNIRMDSRSNEAKNVIQHCVLCIWCATLPFSKCFRNITLLWFICHSIYRIHILCSLPNHRSLSICQPLFSAMLTFQFAILRCLCRKYFPALESENHAHLLLS